MDFTTNRQGPMIRPSLLTLAIGDIGAFAAFGVIGLVSHEKSFDVAPVARSIVPFAVAWLVIAPWFGVFSEAAVRGEMRLLRVVAAWVPVGIVALCARALVFDRELFNAFFVIALVGHGLFLVSWRAVYSRLLDQGLSPA
jgi:hypothetical protein